MIDPFDESQDDDFSPAIREPDYLNRGPVCHECQRETCGESCGFCGNDLCPACFEMGGGFCSMVHTDEQIRAYREELLGPSGRQERQRGDQAHDELKKAGVL